MLLRFLAIFCALLLGAMSVNAQTRTLDGVPLPTNAFAAQPVDENGFLGAWSGMWEHRLKHILVVENIQSNGSAGVIYAYGDMVSWGINKGWARYPATVEGDILTVNGSGFVATYQRLPSGALIGNFTTGYGLSQAVLTPLDLEDTPPTWSGAEFGRITTEISEDGKPVTLETVTFTPKGTGPFPLAIVNHGSTGDGKNPGIAKLTFVDGAIARFLTDRGYLVVFPQRRGRGASDGLYDEGFRPKRAEGYSCDTGRSLAGAERALTDLEEIVKALTQRPDVKPGPVLLSGVSRGGILSMAYAGRHPTQISGVINFVGGWMGDRCPNAAQINDTLFIEAAQFPKPTLSLYGEGDPFYAAQHTKERFDAFQANGGQGSYHLFDVPGGNGHGVSAAYGLWADLADAYLTELAAD